MVREGECLPMCVFYKFHLPFHAADQAKYASYPAGSMTLMNLMPLKR